MKLCEHDLYIDHVDKDGRYVYMCANKKCPQYRKGVYLDGTEANATIKEKPLSGNA